MGHNFGPVGLNVWSLQELSSNASGGTTGAPGFNSAAITKGFSIFAQLNYRIWGTGGASFTHRAEDSQVNISFRYANETAENIPEHNVLISRNKTCGYRRRN